MSFFGNRRQVEQPPVPQPADEKVQPPKPSVPQSPVGFETVLGTNSIIEGVFRSNANVRLDGTFTGTLEITGNVLVGETAKINADINAKNLSIAGAVRGNVSGKKVQLLRTGRIWGDIRATALTTEEGAFIDGKITMVSHEAQMPSAEALVEETDFTETNLASLLTTEADDTHTEESLDDAITDTPSPEIEDVVVETEAEAGDIDAGDGLSEDGDADKTN